MSSRNETSILVEPFAPSATVPPQIALQLRAMMDRINDLEATNAALVDRVAILEDSQDPGETSQDAALREEVVRLQDALLEERDAHHLAVQDLEELNVLRALEIGQDRQRLAALEVPPAPHVQPKQRNQGDILRALLAATGRGKMLQSTARRKMGISKSAFSRLLHTLEGTVKNEVYHRDRRQNVLTLINKKS